MIWVAISNKRGVSHLAAARGPILMIDEGIAFGERVRSRYVQLQVNEVAHSVREVIKVTYA